MNSPNLAAGVLPFLPASFTIGLGRSCPGPLGRLLLRLRLRAGKIEAQHTELTWLHAQLVSSSVPIDLRVSKVILIGKE
ncbi:MAG: hypothetical protein ACRDIB_10855 [Ardenticatenaceae bacterium]